jgi:hypothetical protein
VTHLERTTGQNDETGGTLVIRAVEAERARDALAELAVIRLHDQPELATADVRGIASALARRSRCVRLDLDRPEDAASFGTLSRTLPPR